MLKLVQCPSCSMIVMPQPQYIQDGEDVEYIDTRCPDCDELITASNLKEA